MRILMTTDTVGGVWTFTQELASGLLEQGCAIALFSVGRVPSSEQQAWSSAMKVGWGRRFCYRSVETPLEWMQDNEHAFVEAAPLLRSLAEEFLPDILHSSQFCFGALPGPLPRVITAHSDVLSWAAACRGGELEESPWLTRYRKLVSAGLGRADAVVAPTQWMLTALGSHFDLPARQLVVANGRRVAPAVPRQRKLQAVTAGRLWDEAKSVATLYDVDSCVPILIAGATACEQASAAPVVGAATFVGALSQDALLALFQESAIYVCASRYEPFGLAPLEAALCGCAVLANDIPSLREVWGDGATYYSGAEALSQNLLALGSNRELLARRQAASLARALTYTREAMASAYLATFQEVVANKRDLSHVA